MPKYRLASTELKIMECFWKASRELCKQDIREIFCTQEMTGSMVSFLLSKLAKKGFLIARRQGRNFYYSPAVTKVQYEQAVINESLEKTYGKPIEMILANFCGKASATEEELQNIQEWLRKLEQELKGQ